METARDSWVKLLDEVLSHGYDISPRGKKTRERLNLSTSFDMERSIIACPPRKLGGRFLYAEPAWILSGSNRLNDIMRYAPMLEEFSDDGIFLSGAYGPPVVDQLPYIVNLLGDDPYSRQAVMTLFRPKPRQSKDIPCTISLQFFLRHDRIQCIANMRSSDLWLGFPYDAFTFTCIATAVSICLREVTDRIWGLGDMYMNLGSAHIYHDNINSLGPIFADREYQPEFNPYPHKTLKEFRNYLQERADR